MARPFYITTPIYYVNDRPHIGHAYTTIAADLLARFHRLAGREAFMLTGTDEHGNKIAEAAEAAGLAPQEFCDRVVEHFKNAWKALDVEYDDFIRTTEPRHLQAIEKVLEILYKAKTDDGRSVIYSGTYEGLYCTGCEKFLTEKDLVEGMCPLHRKPAQKLQEKNYFFRLTAYIPHIKKLIENNELLILPEERRREVLGLIEQDMADFSLSREKVKWGIPLPFDKSQVAYVWVDALFNYVSGIGYGRDEATLNKWWYQAEIVHLMAKEILKFHCLYWPAMLMAVGLPLPRTIFLHGFFTVNGEKMSKSLGNQIDPFDLVKEFGADGTRYLLLTQYPFGVDGDIQRNRFAIKYNSDLANDLGNLVSRVVKMIETNFEGMLPAPSDGLPGMAELTAAADALPLKVQEHLNHFRIGAAIDEVMNLVRLTNRFFDTSAPWKLVKNGEKVKAGGVLYVCSELIRIIAILLHPVMPSKTRLILNVFGQDESAMNLAGAQTFFYLQPGTKVKISESIFPRIIETKPAPVPEKTETGEGLLDISEFGKVQLVVAEVLEAEKVAGADKLLKLKINVGDEERQIVAGIAQHYTPEQIKGKKIVVVKNLKPAKIRGIESRGMLLAAKKDGRLTLVIPGEDIPAGATIG